MELTRDQRLHLRAMAHGLKPVVMIGNNGLTDSVIREIAINLDAHELIKVRVLGDDREQREAWFAEICEHLSCAPVQHIGKLLLLYRPAEVPRIEFPKPGRQAAALKPGAPAGKVQNSKADANRPSAKKPRLGSKQPI